MSEETVGGAFLFLYIFFAGTGLLAFASWYFLSAKRFKGVRLESPGVLTRKTNLARCGIGRGRGAEKAYICGIDASGYAAIVFVLICAFIAHLSSFPDYRGCRSVGGELPKAHFRVAMHGINREDSMIVGVMRDGRVYYGSEPVEPAKFSAVTAKINENVRNGAERRVYFKVDAGAKYGDLLPVLDAVRNAGIEDISFVCDRG